MIGVLVVLLCNDVALKISAFQMTLLSFLGQLFTDILIDLLFQSSVSMPSFYGGLLIAWGIGCNLFLERKRQRIHHMVREKQGRSKWCK